MRKNVWENIAKTFNMPLGREFTIDELEQSLVYKFTQNGLVRVDCDLFNPNVVLRILSGELSITPKPWKPKVGDKYYHVEESIL